MKKLVKTSFSDCIKKNRIAFICFFVMSALNLSVFLLYGIMFEPFLYSEIISFAFLSVAFFVDFYIDYEKAKKRKHCIENIITEWKNFPSAESLTECDCKKAVEVLGKETERLSLLFEKKSADMSDYYTAWVHQIKTPISVMRMILGENDSEENRELLTELFRIEQYAEMALQYIRIDSGVNDLVIEEYSLDELIRGCIRKYARQFISRKIKLDYEGTDRKIITDKKWFCLILEQFFSNAVKYAPNGRVSVRVTNDNRLCVSDNGIGIDPSDLPRIFEKGYTGRNGRLESKSSGLGLYLCKRAADMLNIKIEAAGHIGVGSTFIVYLPNEQQLQSAAKTETFE